jgi:IS30 family transposase
LDAKTRDDQALLTLAERKSREFLMLRIANKTSGCVMEAIKQLQETYSEHFSEVFKTITTDNGSEFADLSELEKMVDTLVLLCSSLHVRDKGTVERYNGLIRRFIPKGKRIDGFTGQQISDVETWCNCLQRKVLGYKTQDEILEEEIDRIYQATA